jgi:hypothetical protein
MYDNEGYYVVLPDPDTLPEPYFAGLTWEQISAELDRLEQEAAHHWYMIEQDRQWYEDNSSWFRDF